MSNPVGFLHFLDSGVHDVSVGAGVEQHEGVSADCFCRFLWNFCRLVLRSVHLLSMVSWWLGKIVGLKFVGHISGLEMYGSLICVLYDVSLSPCFASGNVCACVSVAFICIPMKVKRSPSSHKASLVPHAFFGYTRCGLPPLSFCPDEAFLMLDGEDESR